MNQELKSWLLLEATDRNASIKSLHAIAEQMMLNARRGTSADREDQALILRAMELGAPGIVQQDLWESLQESEPNPAVIQKARDVVENQLYGKHCALVYLSHNDREWARDYAMEHCHDDDLHPFMSCAIAACLKDDPQTVAHVLDRAKRNVTSHAELEAVEAACTNVGA